MFTIFSFILIIIFGYLFVSVLGVVKNFFEKIGLAFLLGLGIVTVLMFFYSWIGIKISYLSFVVMLMLLIIALITISKKYKRNIDFKGINLIKIFRTMRWYEKILIIVISIPLILSFILSFYYPITVWDALALYDFVGKVIAQGGYFVQVARQFNYFAEYPLLVSLSHTIVYLSGGTNPQFIYSLYYIAFTLVCYSFFAKMVNRTVALFFTLVLISDSTIFAHSTFAYTNLPYTIFYVTGIIYLYYALTESKNGYFAISAISIGMSTWARSTEPFWITALTFVLIYAIIKKSLYPIIIYFPLFFIIQQPWKIFQTNLYGPSYATSTQISTVGSALITKININQLSQVLSYVYQNIILPWKNIFPILIIALFLHMFPKINKKALIILSIMVVNFLMIYFGTYFFSINFPEWKNIPGSATRMSMFFPPMIVLYAAMVTSRVFKTKKIVS